MCSGSIGSPLFFSVENNILNQIAFEPGRLTHGKNRFMLIRPETLVAFQKAVERETGAERCAGMMMAGGMAGGTKSSEQFRDKKEIDEEEIVRSMCRMGMELGWGDFSLVSFDPEAGRLIIEVKDSPFALAYGPSRVGVCHLIRGVFRGLAGTIFLHPASSVETLCVAKGDGCCRFEIEKE